MAEQYLIEEKVFPVKKSALAGHKVLAAIDRGCSLTKVLFVTDGGSDDEYEVHAALFDNKNFAAGVDYLAAKGFVRQDPAGKLHITGVGCDKFRGTIGEKLGIETEFIDEFVTMVAGVHWLLKSLPVEAVCHPDESIDMTAFEEKSDHPDAKELAKQWQVEEDEAACEGGQFPILLGLFGSGAGFLKVHDSGQCEMVCGVGLSGKPFLGYAKVLLGTCDYNEIMRLASNGRRGNVDNECRDLLQPGVDTPYGRMPASMPIFPFGKAVDLELRREDCKREDIAHSLVAAFALNTFNVLCTSAKMTGVSRIFIGGNMFRHSVMRRELVKQMHYFSMHSLKIKFIATGHSGAIGAMISSPKAAESLTATQQQQQQQ